MSISPNSYSFNSIFSVSYSFVNGDQKYAFGSKERDTETGNDYFEARFLDTDIGRFLSVDPLGFLRMGLNPYNYVQNNPINRVDPTGLSDTTNTKDMNQGKWDDFETGDDADADVLSFPEGCVEIKPESTEQEYGLWDYFTDSRAWGYENAKQNEVEKGRDESISFAPPGGKINSFCMTCAFGGGYTIEIGRVEDSFNNSKWFISHGPVIGYEAGFGFSEKAIRPNDGLGFIVDNFEGYSSGYSWGLLFAGGDYNGNRQNINFQNEDFSIDGDNYNQLGFGVFYGLDLGFSWSRTETNFIK